MRFATFLLAAVSVIASGQSPKTATKTGAKAPVATSAAPALASLPKHPRELKFPSVSFNPPKAADYRHKLSNGATAYLVPDRQLPLINIEVIVRVGGWLEPADKPDLAQFVGSQMRAGGTKTRKPAEFDEQAAFLAAQISSSIGSTSGSANMNCLSRNLDACLDLFVDMLRNPGFAEDRFRLAKAQALQGMTRRNDSTAGIETREFARLMRGEDFFENRQLTKAQLDAMTRQDLVDFHSRYYYPSNFMFAVSGDFDTKEMLAKLEKAFGGWPNRTEAIPPIPKPAFKPKPGVYLVDKKGVNQGRVRVGHIGIEQSNPDHIAVQVMNRMLGGGSFTSRITTRVRSDEGLAYSASSRFAPGTFFPGLFNAGFQSKSPTVAQAIDIIMEEVRRIRDEKAPADEVASQVTYSIEQLSRVFATAAQKAGRFASDDYEKLPEDYWQTYRARLQKVTPEEIQRVARQYLKPEEMVFLVVGDADAVTKGNPDKPQYQLSKFGTIERVPLPDPMTMVYPKP
jgi:zinc protease